VGSALGIVGALLAAASVTNAVFVALGLALAPWARVQVERAVLGVGPLLRGTTARGAVVEVRLLPFSASLSFVGAAPADPDAPPVQPPAPLALWYDAPAWRRALVLLVAPRLATALVAALALGPRRAAFAVVLGASEALSGAFAPLSAGRAHLEAGAAVLASEGFVALACLAACKLLALGALGLPADLAFTLSRQQGNSIVIARVAQTLVGLPLVVAWSIAWVAWALR
jgi:hypothetical protein